MKFNTCRLTVGLMSLLVVVSACGRTPPGGHFAAWDSRLSRADAEPSPEPVAVEPGPRHPPVPSLDELTDQQRTAVTLEQAVVLSLHHNRSMAAQQLQPVIAGSFEQLERSRFDPRLFGSFDFSRDRRSDVSRATGERFDVEGQDAFGGFGIRQRLATGTDLELAATMRRSHSDRTPRQDEARLGLTLTQALLRGADPAANMVGIRQAQLDHRISEYELRGFAEAVVAEVERTFWLLALAQQRIAIHEHALEVAEQLARETRQRIEVGVLAETEALAADAEVALRRQDLIDARSGAEQLRLELLRLITAGHEGDFDYPLFASVEVEMPELPDDELDAHVTLARRHRPDVNEALLRLDQHRLEVVRTRNGLLPRLDLFVNLGKTGFASSFSSTVRELGGPTYDMSVGLQLEYPLGNREAEARHRSARAGREQAHQSVRNLEQLAELDVRRAWIELQRTHRQVAATEATRRLRQQTVDAELERLRVGASTSLLVAQAQRDLVESQIAEIEAIVNVRLALIDLYHLDGTLLTRRGITAPGREPARRIARGG